MRTIHAARAAVARVLLFVAVLTHAGCFGTSPASRFYLLSPISSSESKAAATDYETIVAVSNLRLPGHLDRPQIVTRAGPNTLELAEFDRWGEPLGENFTRVLTSNLTDLLESDGVLITSWRGATKSDYRLFLEARRFDLEPNGAVLDATWGLLTGAEDEVILKRRSVVRETVEGDAGDFGEKAAALSRALGVLSHQLAAGIRETLKARAAK